ncbi:MAG: ABC transporter permease [Coriobacteriales bacterium]|nr:ABC transporter permease [Coriobacteriales bacterium]
MAKQEDTNQMIEDVLSKEADAQEASEEYSLNDDRRVKTLSPTALVMKRFLRNRVAVSGLIILTFMFLFSFVGGMISPYKEDQIFYRYDEQNKQWAAVAENTELRYITKNDDDFPSVARAKFVLAIKQGADSFESQGTTYTYEQIGDELYKLYVEGNDEPVALATYDTVSSSTEGEQLDFEFQEAVLTAVAQGKHSFKYDGTTYKVDDAGTVLDGDEEVAYASRYVVQPLMKDVFLTREFKESLISAIDAGDEEFTYTDEEGNEVTYTLKFDAAKNSWAVMQSESTKVFDTYSAPSPAHPLGTDRNGMDMLTRLMYGGRVSLYIGFIVVFIESIIGVILGGISGYRGGWVDNLIMRIVDVFYCIPSMPIIIILGAAMDALRVDPQIRMLYLMLLLGFLGWPSIARLVRGQILSLREQEFMTATEATGIRASRRIFRHLIPNVIPQLIVTMTMSLGSTIITEATLSFLGLGVKFPFASWGNIINDVNDTYVLTNYWFIWIPAGFCLLATVLAFNLVGDGLRDAFDPKMNR